MSPGKLEGVVRPGRFLAARELGEEGLRAALLGMPFDATTTFRPGARFGPGAIREASLGLEEWSPALAGDLRDVPFADAGDVELPCGDAAEALARIERVASALAQAGLVPVGLGGEHLCTLGVVRALAPRWPGLAVVQVDAHADQRDAYLGERLSHATVMRRVAEVVGEDKVYQVGVRSGAREEWGRCRHLYGRAEVERLLGRLEGVPVYLTVDIDVVDPAFAPGTGTPEPGGWTAADLLDLAKELSRLEVVGMDLVEVAPALDPSGRTAVLAAKWLREALIACGRRWCA